MPNQRSLTNAVKRLVSPTKTKPSLVHAGARPKPHLIQLPVSFEAHDESVFQLAGPTPCQRWISKVLFKWNAKGHPELEFSRVEKRWWYPPQVPLRTSKSPAQENYFGSPPAAVDATKAVAKCNQELLTSAGLHQKIRQVVAVWKMYFVASEYLAYRRCKRKVISWSHGLVSQLDIGHRVQFPCILTSKLACDFEVASLMRQRGLGNSSSQIQRKLQERHAEVWMQKTVQYLQDCKGIASAVTSGLILPMPFDPASAMPPVPKHRWLMQVYAQDVLQRLDEIKATITSQY
ncbi:Sarcoplasmic/endoplasmic reticulum calcium ATPase 2, partial [Dissostichus eleginoides]